MALPPHPGPLPPGEGDASTVALLTERASILATRPRILPLPAGEGRDEGEGSDQTNGWPRPFLGRALAIERARLGASRVIGLLLPPDETAATSLRQGAELAVECANRAAGTRVRLVVRGRVGQWGTDGEEAARLVLDDGVSGLIAPPGGVPSHLALQVAGRTATPVVSLCADSSVTAAGIPWMVRLAPSAREEAGLILRAVTHPAAARRPFRWGLLVPEERAGREAKKELRAATAGRDCRLLEPIRVPAHSADPDHLVAPLLNQADGILIWLEPALAGRLANGLRAAGFAGRLAGPSSLLNRRFLAAAGPAAEGFLSAAPVLDLPSQRRRVEFNTDYRRRFGIEPDLDAAMGFDAAWLLIKLPSDTPFRAFPLTGEQPGASGPLRFDLNGNRRAPLELLEYRSGRFRPCPATLTQL